jgi:hypothetical protein
MDEKLNEATQQWLQGDRTIDAPLVEINLPAFVKQKKEEEAWKNSDRNAITVYKTNGLRIVLIALHKDAEMKQHKSAGIISVQVIEGAMNFTIDKKSINLCNGYYDGNIYVAYAGWEWKNDSTHGQIIFTSNVYCWDLERWDDDRRISFLG